jgi:endonuclease/exonuclease/phosphatase family metal-dependent hydrolase
MPLLDIISKANAKTQKRISTKLIALRSQLDAQIPSRNLDRSLMLATWNIREFDSGKYGLRTDESMLYIAEIISRFDLVAVQEVREDLSGLNRLKGLLGSWWQYIYTDVTEGSKGNRERMAFLFDSRKVSFGGLSGEIVIPEKAGANPSDQLSRTPFLVGFQAGWFKFMLCTVHIYYGTDAAIDPNRLEEIKTIAKVMKDRATDNYTYAPNLILLGDFNIFSPEDVTLQAITSVGFWIPESIQKLPSNVAQNKHYDQIAFISPDVRSQLESAKAGVFNYFNYLYTPEEEATYEVEMGEDYEKKSSGGKRTAKEKTQYYLDWRTHQLSDHLPMWVELMTDFSDEHLKKLAGISSPSTPSAQPPAAGPTKKGVTKATKKPAARKK